MASISNILVQLAFLLACALSIARQEPAAIAPQEKPNLNVESFRAARAYTVGAEPLMIVATIRNAGSGVLKPDSARARLVTLSGLEYMSGDTQPKLPELAPGGAVTYKWQVVPTSADGPLVASLALSAPDQKMSVNVISIPRLSSAPEAESPAVERSPKANVNGATATIENEKVRARILADLAGQPILLLSARTSGGWRQVGTSTPLAEVESGQSGQRPWREMFELEAVRAANSPGMARLTLAGSHGIRWRSEIDLTVRAGSSVIDGEMRIKPTGAMRLQSTQFLPLMAGEGSFGAIVSEVLESPPGVALHQAVRWGEITVGTVARNESPFPLSNRVEGPFVEQVDYRLLSATLRSKGDPLFVERGETIRIRSRLFAISPSSSVKQALAIPPAESAQAGRAHRSKFR